LQPPKPNDLLPLLSAAHRVQFADETLQVFTAELDGAALSEAVAFADHAPEPSTIPSPEEDVAYPAPKRTRESRLWVFRCEQNRWQLAAQQGYLLNEDQGGESDEDGPAGFKVVNAERLLADRDLLRVEWLDFSRLRYTLRSFNLYALRSNTLTPVFRCATTHWGCFGGRSFERTIQFSKEKLPANIGVQMQSLWNSSDSHLPDAEPTEPDDGLPANEIRTETYSYNGVEFITERPACDEGLKDWREEP
jgi:hypothetical protein